MTDKLFKIAAHLIESKMPVLFYVSGVLAYALTQTIWTSIELKYSDLPMALDFIKALTILPTGYWACLTFGTLTYRIAKKHGILVSVLVWVLFGAATKFIHLKTGHSVLEDTLRAVSLLSVGGGILGWLMALHFKLNPEEGNR